MIHREEPVDGPFIYIHISVILYVFRSKMNKSRYSGDT